MIKNRLLTLLFTTVLAALTLQAAPREKKNILSLKNTITDEDIVFPESFDTDVHKMMTNWYLQNYTVLDADVENKSPGEVGEETYIRRLAAMPTVIEMPYNQIVRKHIERYVYRSRTLVEEMLGMSLYYMPIFEQALEKEGLPLELKYLPIVESAMDPNATSRVGAAGLWQFMVGTGKGLGLEINSLVDERRDPYRSSEMAAKYLKNLYQIYNDWSLAIAAYNCGPGNVNKALHHNGGVGDFWDIYDYLPRETRGYVPAFIAANYAMTYYKQHNISPSLASKPLITDTVTVRRRIHFAQIADVLNIPIEEIRTFNPQYRADVIPGDNHPYVLILPSQHIYSFILCEDSIDNYRDDLYAHRQVVEPGGQTVTAEDYISGRVDISNMRTINHKVGRGETASSIAAKYGMTTNELMALNNKSSERVKRGETLKVKAPDQDESDVETGIAETTTEVTETLTDENASEEMAQNEQALFDEVKNIEREAATKAPYKGSYTKQSAEQTSASNDTKQSSRVDDQATRRQAAKANTSDWRERNNKYSHKDKASKKDRKKSDRTAEHSSKKSRGKKASKPERPSEVTVQKGESLTKIAEKAGVSVKDIERANGIENGNKIKAGEKIKIPTKAEAKQAAAVEKKGGKSSSKKDGGKASSDKKGSKPSSKKESKKESKKDSKSSSSSKSSKKSKKK